MRPKGHQPQISNNIFDQPNKDNQQNYGALQGQPVSLTKINEKLNDENKYLEHINIMNWNNHKFSYVTLETRILSSVFTDEIPHFQKCVDMIKGYNVDIENCKKTKMDIIDGPWKNKFYGVLQNLLREVINTKDDRLLQKLFAERVYTWSQEQISKKSGRRSQDQSFFSNLGSRNVQSTTLPSLEKRSRAQTTFEISGINDSLINKSQNQEIKKNNQSVNKSNILDEINQQPSSFIDETLRDYQRNHRTKHYQIIPPSERLQTFRRKQLQFDDPSKIVEKAMKLKNNQQQNESRVTYPKPTGYLPAKEDDDKTFLQDIPKEAGQTGDQPGEQKDEQQEAQKPANEDKGEAGGDDEGDILGGLEDEGEIKEEVDDKEKYKMVPDKKAFINDDLDANQLKFNVKKQFEQKSTFMHYVPSNKVEELKMEQKWLECRHKEVNEKRQNEEIIKLMNEFSAAKSKIHKDINAKLERQIYGSKFTECQYQPYQHSSNQISMIEQKIKNGTIQEEDVQPIEQQQSFIELDKTHRRKKAYSQHVPSSTNQGKGIDISNTNPIVAKDSEQKNDQYSISGLEYQIGKKKIGLARQLYGKLINITKNDDEEEKPRTMAGLSVYSKNLKGYLRPFSAIFDKLTPDVIQNEQLEEIEDVKNRMAKYKINVPIKRLMDSMLVPDGTTGSKTNQLPEPGQGLLENPFFEAGKKKKKKKKK